MEVRDPIHGAIGLTPSETAVLDHPFVQRLRNIKQMGFSEVAFPGAVHPRYLHSVGVMHLAGRAFDAAYAGVDLPPDRRRAFRSAVRLAGLLHDVGHPPFSHCTEFAMPPLRSLGIRAYRPEVLARRGDRRATHEDYTVAVVTESDLARTIESAFPFLARHVAALVSQDVAVDDDFFVVDGLDHRQALSQLISSELDVDRLDYLVRDAYFSGARYGMVDVNWLISNLEIHREAGRALLALDRRAIYAFDDFMVARYHMFIMVYFHHKSVVFEELLKRYFRSPDCDYFLPSRIDDYLWVDDIHLHAHLRRSENRWARAVAGRRAWRRVVEKHGNPSQVDLGPMARALQEAGIDHLQATSAGKLSRYTAFGQKRERAAPIYVVDRLAGAPRPVEPLERATAIFRRYEDERHIARLYVDPDDLDRARAVLEDLRGAPAAGRGD